ncbi:MAG: AAA family ATPase [Phycisphaerales bacterium]|nr:AAA family ATPase [Phycisphaerales bacterium]
MTALSTIQRGRAQLPRRVLLYGVQGVGKAQPLDAKVLTPNGYVRMGDIEIGNVVIGSDGRSHRVLGVYPQGEKDVFRVTFRDGSTTLCCDDHLWFTQTFCERRMGLAGAVRPLRDIRRTLRYGTHFNHAVPCVRPVEFEVLGDRLPIEPWLLGMYLGDGSSSGSSVLITNQESDVQAKIKDTLDRADAGVYTSTAATAMRIRSKRNGRPSILKSALRELGLDGLESQDKFIPSIYLHARVEDRLALLQGLLDSDGFVTKPGAVEFCTVSSHMAEDVCFLIRSLGGSAKKIIKPNPTFTYQGQKRTGQTAYRIFASFRADLVPVSSEKHLAKWSEPRWAIGHTIRSVEPAGRMPCQCIRIDAPDSLYVTDDFIVTHNTTFGAMAEKPIFIQTEEGANDLEVDRFPLATKYADVMNALSALYSEDHDYQTVVIDSLDWLERLIWAEVCAKRGVESIEDVGYGKGYIFALTQWREIVSGLDALRNERGMQIILIAHSQIEKFANPETDPYDRYVPRLQKQASALLSEWCDELLFACHKVFTKTTDQGFNRKRVQGVGTGERIIRTTERPAHAAKNRLNLPDEFPLDYRIYAAFVRGETPQIDGQEPTEQGAG